ncbi:MAG: nodulation protein NfeD [Nitrospirae bacterium]|nr:MAG: nodulation protein NfeD [Nitrospirota bacterium]
MVRFSYFPALIFLLFLPLIFLFFPASPALSAEVLHITVAGVINPVSAEFIGKAVKEAEETNAAALLIELDTPGGLDTSMRSIVKDIGASRVPVIVFVSPRGARAASAGVFITMSAHVAAMAPGTNIGAAHPVSVGGKMDNVTSEKATNDAAAYIKTIAKQSGRNAKWAEDSVRNSVSVTESEALKLNVVDIVADDVPSLLDEIDGRKVTTAAGNMTLKTANARMTKREMGFRSKVLDLISNPNVAYILMLLGFYGLFFELTNPGVVAPGVIGAICLILAFYSFQTLPVNYAGMLLILVGIILFILEVKVTSYGMLTVGGVFCLVLGSMMLFDSPLPFFKVSLSLILPTAIITALFFMLTFRLAYKAYKTKPVTGQEGLVGLEGTAKTNITAHDGMIMVHGELWSAYSDERIAKDESVIITEVKGLKVKVRKTPIG